MCSVMLTNRSPERSSVHNCKHGRAKEEWCRCCQVRTGETEQRLFSFHLLAFSFFLGILSVYNRVSRQHILPDYIPQVVKVGGLQLVRDRRVACHVFRPIHGKNLWHCNHQFWHRERLNRLKYHVVWTRRESLLLLLTLSLFLNLDLFLSISACSCFSARAVSVSQPGPTAEPFSHFEATLPLSILSILSSLSQSVSSLWHSYSILIPYSIYNWENTLLSH